MASVLDGFTVAKCRRCRRAIYAALNKQVKNHKKEHFVAAQGILTPNAKVIKKEIMDGNGISICKISCHCGCKVVDWVEEEWKTDQNLNIVIMDFLKKCNVLPAIINYN